MEKEIIVHLSKIDYEMLANIWAELAGLKIRLDEIKKDVEFIKMKT